MKLRDKAQSAWSYEEHEIEPPDDYADKIDAADNILADLLIKYYLTNVSDIGNIKIYKIKDSIDGRIHISKGSVDDPWMHPPGNSTPDLAWDN